MTAMTQMQDLEQGLRSIGGGYSGKWTCSVTDLTSGEHIGIDEDDVMPTGSLIKVPVLVALYDAVHGERFALTDRTRYGAEHRSLGSGVLSMMEPGVEMTVRDAAVLMIVISDNSATNMCVDLVGLQGVNDMMRSLGLRETTLKLRLGDPAGGLDGRKIFVSTAREMTELLTLIAKHQVVSTESCEDMLRIMRRCVGRAELSQLLPWNEMNMLEDPHENWVAEKGGAFVDGIRAGGAIFRSPRGSFAMSAFCEGGLKGGSGHDFEGNVLLGKLGKAAWDVLA
jgi:beta-lactamase class A